GATLGSQSTATLTIADNDTVGLTAVAAGSGTPSVVVYNADGTVLRTFLAYNAAFGGGVRVATGDVNGDGTDDVITGAGPGGGPPVEAVSGKDGTLFRSFVAYNAAFTGGVCVAAGDVNGDGYADIVTGAGSGGGPHTEVFSGKDGSVLQSFFAYAT